MTLTEFLLARIAEDEAVAREALKWFGGSGWSYFDPIPTGLIGGPVPSLCIFNKGRDRAIADVMGGEPGAVFVAYTLNHQPNRALAECEAKRQIMESHPPRWVVVYRESERLSAIALGQETVKADATSGPVYDRELRVLSLPYIDHPNYLPEWAP